MKVNILIFFSVLILFFSTYDNKQTIKLFENGNTFETPITINSSIKVPFLVDTGASECAIPYNTVLLLIKNGTINKSHLLKSKVYTLANGNKVICKRVLIDHIKIGNKVLYGISFCIIETSSSNFILGQNALERLKRVEFNYEKNEMSY